MVWQMDGWSVRWRWLITDANPHTARNARTHSTECVWRSRGNVKIVVCCRVSTHNTHKHTHSRFRVYQLRCAGWEGMCLHACGNHERACVSACVCRRSKTESERESVTEMCWHLDNTAVCGWLIMPHGFDDGTQTKKRTHARLVRRRLARYLRTFMMA